METPISPVEAAIDRVLAIGDPAARAHAITAILDVLKERGPELKAARQKDVLELRESLTLREVGEQIGLSIPRVDQIAKGK